MTWPVLGAWIIVLVGAWTVYELICGLAGWWKK